MSCNPLRRPLVLRPVAAALAPAGCEHMSAREAGTAQGAGIGAVAGAVAGSLWSKRMEDKRREMERATAGTGIVVARTADDQLEVHVPGDFSFDVGRPDILREPKG